jgi:hypothetical protein
MIFELKLNGQRLTSYAPTETVRFIIIMLPLLLLLPQLNNNNNNNPHGMLERIMMVVPYLFTNSSPSNNS